MTSLLIKAFTYAYPFLIEILLGSENSKRKEISLKIITFIFLVSIMSNILLIRGIYNISKDKISLTDTIEILKKKKDVSFSNTPVQPREPVKDREPRKPEVYTNEKKIHKQNTSGDLDKLKDIDGIK